MLIDCCGHPWLHMEAPGDGPNSESERSLDSSNGAIAAAAGRPFNVRLKQEHLM